MPNRNRSESYIYIYILFEGLRWDRLNTPYFLKYSESELFFFEMGLSKKFFFLMEAQKVFIYLKFMNSPFKSESLITIWVMKVSIYI